MNSVFVLDKSKGISSQQMLSKLRRLYGEKRAGYSGTLDPFATGVLPIYMGEATKLIPFVQETRKTYRACLSLGKATDTLDLTGKEIEVLPVPELCENKINQCIKEFLGPQEQIPPQFSAIKLNGKPLYRYARAGEKIELKSRPIEVFSFQLLGFDEHSIEFEACVSPGTYIRVLAADLARSLNTCGHLISLKRTQTGVFSLEKAVLFDNLDTEQKIEKIRPHFYSIESLFDSVLSINDEVLSKRILHGQKISFKDMPGYNPQNLHPILVKNEKTLLAILESREGRFLQPLRILNFALEG